jgi:hypothetical protein
MTAGRLPTPRAALGIAALACGLALAVGLALSLFPSPAALASAAPPCTTSGLVIWLNEAPGGGTAGSIYYRLELTNQSGRTCTLRGYPGVSAVDLRGRPLGAGAAREGSGGTPRLVTLASGRPTLANGTTATAVLRILDAGAISGCRPAIAAGLRVYPPGQRSSKVVPFPFEACSRAGQGNLAVGALTPIG